ERQSYPALRGLRRSWGFRSASEDQAFRGLQRGERTVDRRQERRRIRPRLRGIRRVGGQEIPALHDAEQGRSTSMSDRGLKAMAGSKQAKFGHFVVEFATPGIGHIMKSA